MSCKLTFQKCNVIIMLYTLSDFGPLNTELMYLLFNFGLNHLVLLGAAVLVAVGSAAEHVLALVRS